MSHNISEIIKNIKVSNTSVTEKTSVKEQLEVIEESLLDVDGFVEVRNHQLFVINPKQDGKQPCLFPNKKVKVYINGELLKKEQAVFEEDEITWETPPEVEYKTTISKDHLYVYLYIYPEIYQTNRLKNKKRSNRFIIEAEPISRELNLEEVVSEIVEDVYKKNIRIEINTTAIIDEILAPTFKEITIAEGLPVIPASDGYIKKFFSTSIKEVLEEVKGTIDFKNRVKIPTVEPGDVIAQIIPPKPGMPGHDVYGKELKPNTPKEIVARAKPKVKLTDDGNAIALVPGRPSLTGTSVKYFDVLDVHEVYGDVDMSTGNIHFNGDVIIRGHVKDNMKIECSGSLFIYGSVYHSTLISSQNIYIFGNVMQSKISAGQFGLYYSEMYKVSQSISSTLKQLNDALSQVKHVLSNKNIDYSFGYIVSTLIESKFPSLMKNVEEFYRISNDIRKAENDLTLNIQITTNALRKFSSLQSILSIESEHMIHSTQVSLRELIQKMESLILEESDITFYSASHSQIKSNGKLIVKKEGVINSTLFSGSEIIFESKKSVIRGGKIEAVKNIHAGIVGTTIGKAPHLYAGEKIEMNEVHQAHVTMHTQKVNIDEQMNNLTLSYNENDERIDSNQRLPFYL
ncbi:FapA family protein [Evansella cellulosilytica]|uniref:Flagellar Assembly Protein A N-terminal region domain-containing protein n=1 Tax=Evansella cellulosilytica (strain ATCC 21833 / DSM 2522 / FERM P-1141 / JCM 9156 / N-4) TaxID=649639 RepID=E6TTW4_EVAC2|nr:FapA family protein [Evansella cellulosilytica]ADU31995.1 protein of unknown function DUF342 [Evansella cellulosilytica DSM 2522]